MQAGRGGRPRWVGPEKRTVAYPHPADGLCCHRSAVSGMPGACGSVRCLAKLCGVTEAALVSWGQMSINIHVSATALDHEGADFQANLLRPVYKMVPSGLEL